MGQIALANPPVLGAGKLYLLSASYGNSVGTDVPLLVETSEVVPAGPLGQVLFRRVDVPLEYDAACSITVTPIVDFQQVQTATTVTYAAPTQRTRQILKAPLSKAGTTLRAIIAVATRSGVVSLNTPSVISQPRTGAGSPVGEQ